MASACEVHLVECGTCSTLMLVQDPIEKGDKVKCPSCSRLSKIDEIVASCRTGRGKQTHDGQHVDN